ncbi:hypothetical protein GALMADRAFT_148452 [Galerina marginata CBS 339.88]|uniref:ATP-dependent DNA ligase family profile domain-containing protein n=1 Tax=Galerina marginata (strain CBS 339.88) TaxID=685588 RepID=A0A067SG49_GALM3|nr:hypothetical protein GALMADRAFT_148452 [Galerina marginata CBS 339.88]
MSGLQENSAQNAGIPFSFFCSLVRAISNINPKPPRPRPKQPSPQFEYPALQIFSKWVNELRRRFSPLPPNTTAICFRMLFPEEDIRRKYDIQETRMTQLLEQCFGIDRKAFEKWSLEDASGCLGQELKVVLDRSCPHLDGFISPLTIADVDELLDELASKSGYSHQSVRSKYPQERSRSRADIIRCLFRPLSPEDAAALSQIILKDLKPLMYPLTEFHYTTALTKFNSESVKMLRIDHAMNAWDHSKTFSGFYRMRASLDAAAAYADEPSNSRCDIEPAMNVPVAIPKSEKGQGCQHALDFLQGSSRVWAETKYDGERAQIHVEIRADNSSRITIFSKSKRDSTHDRHAVHSIIRSALGLDPSHQRDKGRTIVRQNVILDAEMVAFRGGKVDEFWRIRELIDSTAHGIRRSRKGSRSVVAYEHESMDSEANEGINLGLVFFDVVYLDSTPLHSRPYACRRVILESLVQPEFGKAMLADRYLIDMSTHPHETLRKIFSEHIASHEEGLVIKAEDSRYNDYRKPWVKLKKDYTPDFGDNLTLVILGASWEKIRGRSLRVPPTTYTTFYIGALDKQSTFILPKFHIYFTASYGLDREKLEEVNFLIKSSNPIPYSASNDLPFKFTVFQGLSLPPTVILRTPLAVDIFGAGFTKAAKSQHYELRFPRITKIYRPSERSWKESLNLEDLHRKACNSVGRDRSDKDLYDFCNQAFGKPSSPSVNSPRKRKARAASWDRRLDELERKIPRHNTPSSVIDLTCSPSQSAQKKVRGDSKPLTPRTNVIGHPSINAEPIRSRPCPYLTPPRKQVPNRLKSSTAPKALPSLEGTLAWFAQPASKKCAKCASWKKRIPLEGRVHSLQALLVGCGWTGTQGNSGVKRGVIIIDESDEDEEKCKDRILYMLHEIPHRKRVEIEVVGCRSSSL